MGFQGALVAVVYPGEHKQRVLLKKGGMRSRGHLLKSSAADMGDKKE